jgi:hypothetical protein
MAKATILGNVILFARAGFRGVNDVTQVEQIMTAVCESIDGTDLMVDGESVGSISNARVEGSLIRGDVEISDASFLKTDEGLNLMRRIGARVEAPAAPAKAAAKPAAKPVKKATKAAEPEEEEGEDEEPEEEQPVKKAAPKKVVGKPTSKPAPGKGKAIVPMNKKIKVNL